MSIYKTQQTIYPNVRVGMEIGYTKGYPEKTKKTLTGIVTKIIHCNQCEDDTVPCTIKIGIDGKEPDCFMYGNDSTAIRYIKDVKDFIDESEFML